MSMSEVFDSSRIIFDPVRGEFIDQETGEVVADYIMSTGPEWRAYSQEEYMERARVGPEITRKVHDYGVTTFVGGHGKLSILQKRLRRSGDNLTRKEIDALAKLNELAGKIDLPEVVVEDAGMLIKKLVSKGYIKKRNLELILGALIYKVSIIRGVNLDREHLAKTLNIDFNKIFKTAKKLEWDNVFNELKENVSRNKILAIKEASVCGGSGVYALIDKLNIPREVKDIARRILDSAALADNTLCSGKNPKGLVGAIVYLASVIADKKISQQAIAEMLKVSEVTIRNRYKNILDKIDIVIKV